MSSYQLTKDTRTPPTTETKRAYFNNVLTQKKRKFKMDKNCN